MYKSQQVVVHRENQELHIPKTDLDIYLNDGWVKGFSTAHKQCLLGKHKGKEPWNKGTKGIMKANSTTWKKGSIPWNKGKGNKNNWKKKPTISSLLGRDNMLKLRREHISEAKRGHGVTLETREKIRNTKKGKKLPSDRLLIKTTKQYLTRKRNNTFNTSNPESTFYDFLLKQYSSKTIYRQYKDERYPYYCDFYIKEDDLFIECNYHWTHGGKPYDPNDKECQEKLKLWQEKAKTSQFYVNAINVWTVRDVEKQHCAKEAKLNYKVIY